MLVTRSRSRDSTAQALVRTSMTRTIHQNEASIASASIVSRKTYDASIGACGHSARKRHFSQAVATLHSTQPGPHTAHSPVGVMPKSCTARQHKRHRQHSLNSEIVLRKSRAVCLTSCHHMKYRRSSWQLSPRHEKLCNTAEKPMLLKVPGSAL